MEELSTEMVALHEAISRTEINYKKLGLDKRNETTIRGRLKLVEEKWQRLVELDLKARLKYSAEDKMKIEYFSKNQFLQIEDAYLSAIDFLNNMLHPFVSNVSDHAETSSRVNTIRQDCSVPKLPKITLPTFSGNYVEWESFRDLFVALIINNDTLTNASRLHYLKTSLIGDANHIIKHVTLTDVNFSPAWDLLKKRFDNKRALINAHLQAMASIPCVSNGSITDLKVLRDNTNEALTALKNLNRPTESWDDVIVFWTVRKLDIASLKEWETHLADETDYPTFEKLNNFLDMRIRTLEAIEMSKSGSSDKVKSNKSRSVQSHTASSTSKCLLCKENHSLFRCKEFKTLPTDKRREFIFQKHACVNCLSPGHRPNQCASKYTCAKCHRKHNTLLHLYSMNSTIDSVAPTIDSVVPKQDDNLLIHNINNNLQRPSTSQLSQNAQTNNTKPAMIRGAHHVFENKNSSCHLNNYEGVSRSTLLATAVIELESDNGRCASFRVLMDQGSECSFITEKVLKMLHPTYHKIDTQVYGVGGELIGTAKKLAQVRLRSKDSNQNHIVLQALVLFNLTSYTPPKLPNQANLKELSSLNLADPDPFGSDKIDVILGADRFGSCLLPGLKQGTLVTLTAQNSLFGWILSGPIQNFEMGRLISVCHSTTAELHADLSRFWEMEEPPTTPSLTEDELRCEEHFVANHVRLPSGQYMIRLPFRDGPPIEIGSSLGRAKLILEKTLARLKTKPAIQKEYFTFLSEYKELNHMELVNDFEETDSSQTVYLPHHPIIRENSSTTHLRVVFNASSLTSDGSSLNSHLHIGPKLLTDLVSIILRWRMPQFVFAADVEKMFRQIKVDPRDCNYQRILWHSPDGKLEAWRLTTVTYGTACAPYLANRVIKQLARDEGPNFIKAQAILENNLYVDDVLFGADTIEEANELREQVSHLMRRGGFHLRKWASNDELLLSDCPQGNHERAFDFFSGEDIQLKVLGLRWDPTSDNFKIHVLTPDIKQPSKRKILSVIAKLYDPLGWLSPVIVVAKRMIQELWIRKLDWDDSLPDDLIKLWHDFYSKLNELEKIRIPRWTGHQKTSLGCELHGFSDASARAYSAAVYLRILQENGEIEVILLFAKTKIAPILPVTIPRLELCGAQLLAKTLHYVVEVMGFLNTPQYCHTDSTVVLAWLGKHPTTWKSFVSNRVAQIHKLVPRAKWRHVPTGDNLADCSSRGLLPDQILNHPLWWRGPPWLSRNSVSWPNNIPQLPEGINLEKTGKLKTHFTHHVASENILLQEMVTDSASWPKLIRVTAFCLRFLKAFRKKWGRQSDSEKLTQSLTLETSEINQASLFWILYIQNFAFATEIRSLNKREPILSKSPLKALNPFLDNLGVLRVGGRLQQAPISYDEKHPKILPLHRISELIARHAHLRSMHGGNQLTLYTLRQGFWIIGGRNLVKSIIRRCVTCVRERAAIAAQLMGSLPDFRTTNCRPFTHTGVDYAGPFQIRFAPGRGQKSYKGYVALFVCCVTRAIHLELVSDYTSQGFLAAYQRFVSRRGMPAHLYSDNGTTFQGADRELRHNITQLRRDSDLRNTLTIEGTSWHFIPPAAPNFGGLWEAGVKSLKHHLRRCVGAHTLTFEEFTTTLTRIEACLNSRPIGPHSDEPDDFSYLTPGHFLIGAPLTSPPEPSVEFVPENRLTRWQIVQRITQMFWRRWNVEYLHSLQQRYKWQDSHNNLEIGSMVLIKQDALPPSKWQLGRIIKTYVAKDGLIRTVRIKTATSEYDRSISKVCPLPLSLVGAAE